MMHGYYWDYACPVEGAGLFSNGLVVYAMGLGLLVILGIVLWFAWSRTATRSAATPSFPVPFDTVRSGADDAERIVRERFARGEIDRDEFDRLVAALRSK